MNQAQLREMHAKAMEAATDENTTLDVTAGVAATIPPLSGGSKSGTMATSYVSLRARCHYQYTRESALTKNN
jgi:hypothetical protein